MVAPVSKLAPLAADAPLTVILPPEVLSLAINCWGTAVVTEEETGSAKLNWMYTWAIAKARNTAIALTAFRRCVVILFVPSVW